MHKSVISFHLLFSFKLLLFILLKRLQIEAVISSTLLQIKEYTLNSVPKPHTSRTTAAILPIIYLE